MDSRFYNILTKRKKGRYVFVHGTGETRYDDGLFDLSSMVRELLIAQYYSVRNASHIHPEQISETMKAENEEPRFLGRVLDVFIAVTLSKLIDHKKDSWNFDQLVNEVSALGWSDLSKLRHAVSEFKKRAALIKALRNQLYAHKAKVLQPMIGTPETTMSHRELILQAMETLDLFVDGEIPYVTRDAQSDEIDLRNFIQQSTVS